MKGHMSRRFIVVRCPRCGSTDAGEAGGYLEFTEMRCSTCGHMQLCDEYQIKDSWNVDLTLPDDAVALPARLPPDLPAPCPDCRDTPRYFTIRPSGARDDSYVELEKLYAIRRCRSCFICYRFGFSAGGMVSDDEDEVDRLDAATSRALLALSAGELTTHELSALAALPDFSWWRIEDAVTTKIDYAPILATLRAELHAGRELRFRLIASAARAGADVAEFVAPTIVQLCKVVTQSGQHASERATLISDVIEAYLERELSVSAAIEAGRILFAGKAWLGKMRPRFATLCA